MFPEIGLFLIILSTVLSLILSTTAIAGIKLNNAYLLGYTKPLNSLVCLTLASALVILGYSFVTNDFSVAYVANNSNTQLALFYKIAAIWGSHEGSMLFWVFFISLWGTIIFNYAPKESNLFHTKMIAVLALVIFGFSLFMVFTSNPFARLLPEMPIEGRDLNPILQDIGLIIHPPLLFLGYVGLTICFAASIAALLSGGLTKQLARYMQPWAILAWVFLTGGNAFGSWWAYNELGWGGWWFWDPVENASFIPWLISTALLHSVLMTSKRGILGSFSIFLGILAFSLSLLGSFLVRSGVVQSVHAFASDPTRGMSILTLLIVFAGTAMALFAQKAQISRNKISDSLCSKEIVMLLGNVLLMVAAASVLLGTCYPLIIEVITGTRISVGAPYFNSIFIPIASLIFLLMGLAPLIDWQKSPLSALTLPLVLMFVCAALAVLISVITKGTFDIWLFLGLFTSIWIISATLFVLIKRRASARNTTKGPQQSSLRFYVMCCAHVGVAISVLGATFVSNFEQEELLRMGPGQGKTLAGYNFIYEETQEVDLKSYSAIQAKIRVEDADNEQLITHIYPQRQTFKSNAMQMSAAGISSHFWRDLYISMGQQLTDHPHLNDNEYLIRINFKPLVNWIWLGALMMMLSGLLLIICRKKAPLFNQDSAQEKTSSMENSNESSTDKK
ncbi:heme lyase CcmF/NrfE family subunit [Shewanella intestini]|uniref:Heme lyase CcmF/NrfE family subunit n=1 Tax=Shewanella intestini TaxID=2017544 RepID=A0ABS5I631_9GAMM|nr:MULTISPECIES: heme lyase CcmF/NrfE family subunit [Shewanella]MBR9728795.1 heme lyase CcmF/NrfE family subunit [Shewanella intestini]MRG36870.1 heme lyase CcmF/NrfE family subunit [Shewanella sp. XMDDZSB0408]